MTEIRCVKCNRLLMKAKEINVEIKCPKCGCINRIMYIPPDGSYLGFNEELIADFSGVHRVKDYERRKFKKMEAISLK